jgi:hypothetical protein
MWSFLPCFFASAPSLLCPVLLQIEILVNSAWPRAVAGWDAYTPRELCRAVISRLADTVSEFVGDLCGHLEREEEAVVSSTRLVGGALCHFHTATVSILYPFLQVALLLNLKGDAFARFQRGLGGGEIGSQPTAAAIQAPLQSTSVRATAAPKRRTGAGCCGGNEYGGCCSY